MVKTVAILGLGLMGGSLGLGLRALSGARPHVHAYARRRETRKQAQIMGVADAIFDDPAACCEGADLVVLCVPIFAMQSLLKECLPGIGGGTIVTDVGSTKMTLTEQLQPMLIERGAQFVGSHPIAGSEAAGIHAARECLYRNAVVVVTNGGDASDADMDFVSQFWASLGGRVSRMSSRAHDDILARTSHLPHLVAAALTRTVLRASEIDVHKFCGTGFRDSTRIAAGSEAIWADIVSSNRDAILSELDAIHAELSALRECVAEADDTTVREYLRLAREQRASVHEPFDHMGDVEGSNE